MGIGFSDFLSAVMLKLCFLSQHLPEEEDKMSLWIQRDEIQNLSKSKAIFPLMPSGSARGFSKRSPLILRLVLCEISPSWKTQEKLSQV